MLPIPTQTDDVSYIRNYYIAYVAISLGIIGGSALFLKNGEAGIFKVLSNEFLIDGAAVMGIIVLSYILRLCELTILFLLNRLIFLITNSSVVSFFGMTSLYLCCFAFGSSGYFAIGNASLSQLFIEFQNGNFLSAFTILGVNAVVIIILSVLDKWNYKLIKNDKRATEKKTIGCKINSEVYQ